ncbi:MAG: PadR family transcriptional regulator [Candidatus Thorarchaeota archaeon]
MPKKRFTSLKTFILGVMNHIPKPMSGYELITIANEWHYDHYINATNASFYYTLRQLEGEGFIKESGTKQEGNRPEKTIYRLTNKGRKEFQEQMKFFLAEIQDIYYDIDSTMPFITIFGSIVGKEFILDSINMQIEKIKAMFDHVEEGEKIVTSHFSYEFSPFNILPLKHWKLHAETELKWLEIFKEMVESIDDFKQLYRKFVEKSLEITQEK